MPDFKRGLTSFPEDTAGRRNSKFSPFAPTISWRQDREEKYILFLNQAEDIPTIQMHEWIEVGTRQNGKPIYEWFISRKDSAIGEEYDDIEDRLGQPAKERTVAVAVELEPTFSEHKGRKRPTGFKVKTDIFERRADEGVEEVTMPVIGTVIQSRHNFFGWVGSFNENTAPIEETPLHVIRRGRDANTTYDFTPFLDQSVDFTNLFEYLDGVSYLAEELESLLKETETLEPQEAALSVGTVLLEKRLNELADKDRYERLINDVTSLPDRFGKSTTKASRPKSDGPSLGSRAKFAKLRAEVEGR